jgi:hypothetical protein
MKKKRFLGWVGVSIFMGTIWGIWQGGVIQGLIYGCMIFVGALAYEGYLSLKNKE